MRAPVRLTPQGRSRRKAPSTAAPGPVSAGTVGGSPRTMPETPITQDDVKVREVTHYQWSWTGSQPGDPGTFTLQLILDQGARESMMRLTAEDADILKDLLQGESRVYFDIERQVLMFGVNDVS